MLGWRDSLRSVKHWISKEDRGVHCDYTFALPMG